MNLDKQFEREEDELSKQYAEGNLTLQEYNREMRNLQREFREMMHEQAQDAYDDVIGDY